MHITMRSFSPNRFVNQTDRLKATLSMQLNQATFTQHQRAGKVMNSYLKAVHVVVLLDSLSQPPDLPSEP